MADVRSASGVPVLAGFGGTSSPSPGTPLYVDIATGDLYAVLAGDVVTLVGSIPTAANLVLAQQVFDKHFISHFNFNDMNNVIQARVFRSGQSPAGWGA